MDPISKKSEISVSNTTIIILIVIVVILIILLILSLTLGAKRKCNYNHIHHYKADHVSGRRNYKLRNVGRIEYKPMHKKFRYGLSGTFRRATPSAYRNTIALTAPQIQITNLFLWNDPKLSQFESISTHIPRLDTGAVIPANWPNVNLPPGNQMCCGCCWAYSLAKTAFARYCIQAPYTNPGDQMFSVDAIIANTLGKIADGDTAPECNGCAGGDILSAWDILSSNKVPFQFVSAENALQATGGSASSGNACQKLENCKPLPKLPNTSSNCHENMSLYSPSAWSNNNNKNNITGSGPIPNQIHTSTSSSSSSSSFSDNKLSKFAIIPYWQGADTSTAGEGFDSTVKPELDNFVFFAAAIQHEIAHSGPVQFGMEILNIEQFQEYTPGDLVVFLPSSGQPGGHAMMITGWHWIDLKDPSTQNQIKNFSQIRNSYKSDLTSNNCKNLWQLVWTIQNQWALPDGDGWSTTNYWGMENSAHVAASFYICVDSSGNPSAKVLDYHSTNYMELNTCAGNFWPIAKPSVARLLADHVSKFY